VNDAPTAVNDSVTATEDTVTTFTGASLTANDSTGPSNESSQTLTVTAVGSAAHGTVSVSGGNVTYTPAADYNGTDSFTYTITDNGTTNGSNDFKTSTATITVTVAEVNDAPTAVNDSVTATEDTVKTFTGASL